MVASRRYVAGTTGGVVSRLGERVELVDGRRAVCARHAAPSAAAWVAAGRRALRDARRVRRCDPARSSPAHRRPCPRSSSSPARARRSRPASGCCASARAGHSLAVLDARRGRLDGFDVEVARGASPTTRAAELELVEFRWPASSSTSRRTLRRRHERRHDAPMASAGRARSRARSRASARSCSPGPDRDDARPSSTSGRAGSASMRAAISSASHGAFPPRGIVPIGDNRQLAEYLPPGAVDALVSDELEAPIFRRRLPDAGRDRAAHERSQGVSRTRPRPRRELDAWLLAREVDGSLAGVRARMLGPQWGVPTTGPRLPIWTRSSR